MNVSKQLIPDALNYYDNNNQKIHKLYKSFYYYTNKRSKLDNVKNLIYFYDKDKKELTHFDFEVIGLYTSNSKTWLWAWASPELRKNATYKIKQVLDYGIDLDPDEKLLKTELITSKFFIDDPIQLDIHIAIASYMTKIPFIYPLIINTEISLLPDDEEFYYPIERSLPKNYEIHFLFLLNEKIL